MGVCKWTFDADANFVTVKRRVTVRVASLMMVLPAIYVGHVTMSLSLEYMTCIHLCMLEQCHGQMALTTLINV